MPLRIKYIVQSAQFEKTCALTLVHEVKHCVCKSFVENAVNAGHFSYICTYLGVFCVLAFYLIQLLAYFAILPRQSSSPCLFYD